MATSEIDIWILPYGGRGKRRFGLRTSVDSLSGIVYSLTEVPEDLIRQIVDTKIAELAGGAPILPSIAEQLDEMVMARLTPILRRLAAMEQVPDEP